jgi:hypothetical protein
MNRGRVGEERGSKETDGCPLTLVHFYVKIIDISEGSRRSDLLPSLQENDLLTLQTTQRSSKPSCCSDSKNCAQQDSSF